MMDISTWRLALKRHRKLQHILLPSRIISLGFGYTFSKCQTKSRPLSSKGQSTTCVSCKSLMLIYIAVFHQVDCIFLKLEHHHRDRLFKRLHDWLRSCQRRLQVKFFSHDTILREISRFIMSDSLLPVKTIDLLLVMNSIIKYYYRIKRKMCTVSVALWLREFN